MGIDLGLYSEAFKIQMGPHTFGSASMVEWATKRR